MVSPSALRTLPIRIAPAQGEALDSWLEAAAHRVQVPFGDLLGSIGLLNRTGARQGWPVDVPADTLARIGQVMSVPTDVLAAMTFARYRGTVLDTPARAWQTGMWGRRRGSRYCPDCLADSGGRWQLHWRLGWFFACTRHRCLLADTCPDCDRIQRGRVYPHFSTPHPGRCAGARRGAANSGRLPRCGAPLAQAPVTRLTHDHRLLRLQHTIETVIESSAVPSPLYTEEPDPAVSFLSDLKALANRVLSCAVDKDLGAGLPPNMIDTFDLAWDTTGRCVSHDVGPTDRLTAGTSAAHAAVALSAALRILEHDDFRQAGAAMRWLIDVSRNNGVKVSAVTGAKWGGKPSPAAQAIQLAALGPAMKPTDQLRCRVFAARPRLPATSREGVDAIAAQLPSMLWPAFTLPFAADNAGQLSLRPALAAAVLLVGARLSSEGAAMWLGSLTTYTDVSRMVSLLQEIGMWTAAGTMLTRISDYIADNGAPIDYDRRRRLDYGDLLPEATWHHLCMQTDEDPGQGPNYMLVRHAMFEELSGLPCSRAPFAGAKPVGRLQIDRFPADLDPQLTMRLEEHARMFLADRGVEGEPLTWHPPLSLLDDLQLPKGRLDRSTTAALRWALYNPPGRSGPRNGGFGTTLHAIYVAARARHPGHRWGPSARVGSTTRERRRADPTHYDIAKAALTGEELYDLHINQNLSLQHIADSVGVGIHAIYRLAHEYAVPLGAARRARQSEDDARWLHEQYVAGKRSIADIAREHGIKKHTLTKMAERHSIPMRGRGALSHQKHLDALLAAQIAPELLRPVLESFGGAGRLQRFAFVAGYPTITAAAEALGRSPSALTSQMRRLDRQLGGRLLTRGQYNKPMTLTDLGLRAIRAWREFEQRTRGVPTP